MTERYKLPLILVLMGVSGCGKSTVAGRLREKLNAILIEGDDFHAQEAKEKMSKGIPLKDLDRWPWLTRLKTEIEFIQQSEPNVKVIILICSALKRSYRDFLRDANSAIIERRKDNFLFIFLKVDEMVLETRLLSRPNHYMKVNMLKSQLCTLEEPSVDQEPAIWINASGSIENVVNDILIKIEPIISVQ